MSRLIDSLPGVSMSVEEVTETLIRMWDAPVSSEGHPMDFRASQMNLIVHFGLTTTEAEAGCIFDRAIRFAQKYPCRLIVLCPTEATEGPDNFEGKLFSQCYLGRHLRETCCCEALILGYSPEDSDFLESQVSIWLETDLPVYHWLHRVPAERIEGAYHGFLKQCRRVVYDGEREGSAYDGVKWPVPGRVRDLAAARTLPLRQHLGQFLSGYEPEILAGGLRGVTVQYAEGYGRLASHLLRWQANALAKCGERSDLAETEPKLALQAMEPARSQSDPEVVIDYTYEPSGKAFRLSVDFDYKTGYIRCNFREESEEHALHIERLEEETVLAEALFFD